MKIYLNEDLIAGKTKIESKAVLTALLAEKLEREIVDQVYLDGVEVSYDYFQENKLDFERLDEIKFITKAVTVLIRETLSESASYLPKLKKAIINSANLFRQQQNQAAAQLLNQTLAGLEWYLEITQAIITLLEDDQLSIVGKEKLENFKQALNRAMIALQNDNYDYLADLLEAEIVAKLEELAEFNQDLA